MKRNLGLFYRLLTTFSVILTILGLVLVVVEPGSERTILISTRLSEYGLYLLFFLLISKSLYFILKDHKNRLTNFLRVNNIYQRELGIIIFILFFGHSIIELITYFGTNSFLTNLLSIIIPVIIFIYLMLTSFNFFQKKNKNWKKNHSLIWLSVPLIIVHIILLSTLSYLYIILILIIIGVIIIEFFMVRKRGKKHLILWIIGSIAALITFFSVNALSNHSIVAPTTNETNDNGITGTFEGSAMGYEGVVKVAVTIDNGDITAVEVVEEKESHPQNAFEVIPPKIVESDTTDVDTVSGATHTSVAIINATNDALTNAR